MTVSAPLPERSVRRAGEALRPMVVGADESVPVLTGERRPYINFDNAASTPVLKPVLDAVQRFLPWYSNVHRGTGFKSKVSSMALEAARSRIARFVGAEDTSRVVLFSKNTTEAINHLASRFPFEEDSVVVTTMMEHHSNELPWRRVARVVHADVRGDGRIDDVALHATLQELRGRVKLLAVTGASNVTGFVNPIGMYARWAHEVGAKIFVDAAQLAPHRPIRMLPVEHPQHIDFLAFSAHKMYAPFGLGVLVADRETLESGDPFLVGGGTVDIVNTETAFWAGLPDREEAGTPTVVGAIALAAAMDFYGEVGWRSVIDHELELTSHALKVLSGIPGVVLYGANESLYPKGRLGVVAFNVEGVPHSLVSAILSYEWGIGTRNGCFCAHTYVKKLLEVDDKTAAEMELAILAHDRSRLIGAVRASFGMYNIVEEVDTLAKALRAIAEGRFSDGYILNRELGEYEHPEAERWMAAHSRLIA